MTTKLNIVYVEKMLNVAKQVYQILSDYDKYLKSVKK